jgi:EF-P beta-lysylation protein EpmB
MSNAADRLITTRAWQEALSDLITDPKELLTLLELDHSWLHAAEMAAKQFPLKVPRQFVSRMQKGNPNDPLLKQVLPLGMELQFIPGYSSDPLQEVKANVIPGMLHKYNSRILITLTSACAIHCRYCFRRHFPYASNNPGTQGLKKIFDYIEKNNSINEVILSGGDPLAVNDQLLNYISQSLNDIPHVKRLRIHTRLPVVLPERVTPTLTAWLNQLRQNCIIVIHANHPQEISTEVTTALLQLHEANATMLNQTVLLKGINDDASVLSTLSEKLFLAKVLPYYLHVLDKVQGAAHFDIDLHRAYNLHKELCDHLPGYLVPRLVQENPGEPSKTLL